MLKNRKYKLKAKKNGFSFVELIVAVFIFVLVVTTSTEVFVKMIKNYKSAREIQRDLEDAQYAMNLMAKTIRTSSVTDPSVPSNVSDIIIFDYSQNKCIKYAFTVNKLQYGLDSTSLTKEECTIANMSGVSLSDMISGYVNNGNFAVIPSASGVVGKVTISMQICPASGCPAGADKVQIQTSVSLRDYTEAGI